MMVTVAGGFVLVRSIAVGMLSSKYLTGTVIDGEEEGNGAGGREVRDTSPDPSA